MSNHQIHSKVSPLVTNFTTTYLIPRGFDSFSTCVIDIEDPKQGSTVMLIDPGSDIGTYQFVYDWANSSLVVANYFDSSVVYGKYKTAEQFTNDFDLPIKFGELVGLLHLLMSNEASLYIGIDSAYIDHTELLTRDGWTDRRIKKEFGIVPKCEFDRVSYYRLNEVIQKEQ